MMNGSFKILGSRDSNRYIIRKALFYDIFFYDFYKPLSKIKIKSLSKILIKLCNSIAVIFGIRFIVSWDFNELFVSFNESLFIFFIIY